jgi:hypothetical protein
VCKRDIGNMLINEILKEVTQTLDKNDGIFIERHTIVEVNNNFNIYKYWYRSYNKKAKLMFIVCFMTSNVSKWKF